MNDPIIHVGDCLDVLRTMGANSVDAIVTDPPYGLTQNKKGGSGAASVNLESPYGRARIGTGNGAGGFMGMKWDADVPSVDVWAECLRVLKPGGHLLAFAGTRTQHRMAVRIEDAGFEIRDMIAWVYGSGFPKSHNGPWGGTALKPALEPITVARKPLIGTVAENVLAHGTGALNIDGCRVASDGARPWREANRNEASDEERKAYGKGLAGSKAVEDTVLGRWPANLIHDGSEEGIAAFPAEAGGGLGKRGGKRRGDGDYGLGATMEAVGYGDSGSAARFFYCAKASRKDRNDGCDGMPEQLPATAVDRPGQAERGTGRGSRSGPRANHHPTVKPTDLMRYLCRLVTPPGGLVLDPFMGSGSTGRGAILEGFRFVGIERDPDYAAIARARIDAVMPKPEAPADPPAVAQQELIE